MTYHRKCLLTRNIDTSKWTSGSLAKIVAFKFDLLSTFDRLTFTYRVSLHTCKLYHCFSFSFPFKIWYHL